MVQLNRTVDVLCVHSRKDLEVDAMRLHQASGANHLLSIVRVAWAVHAEPDQEGGIALVDRRVEQHIGHPGATAVARSSRQTIEMWQCRAGASTVPFELPCLVWRLRWVN